MDAKRLDRGTPRLVLLLPLLVALAGCGFAGVPLRDVAKKINLTYLPPALQVAAGDTLEVRFPHLSDFNHTARVAADGTASFLFLDQVRCAGRTLADLDAELSKAYEKQNHLNKPDLTITITDRAPRNIYFVGEIGVNQDGAVELPIGGLGLIEALAMAGGHNKKTGLLKNIKFVRWVPGETAPRIWHIDARFNAWEGAEKILMTQNDIIYIPNTPIDEFNIWIDQYIRQNIPIPFPTYTAF